MHENSSLNEKSKIFWFGNPIYCVTIINFIFVSVSVLNNQRINIKIKFIQQVMSLQKINV